MKDNQIVINDGSTVIRTYLQIARPWKILPYVLLVISAACALLWVFFGKLTVSVTGYCESSEKNAVFLLPLSSCDRVHQGDTIWIGNNAGVIDAIYSEAYFTYDDIRDSDEITFRNFINSGSCDEDMSYYLCSAVFEEDITGIREYRIVTDTVAPYQIFTGDEAYGR